MLLINDDHMDQCSSALQTVFSIQVIQYCIPYCEPLPMRPKSRCNALKHGVLVGMVLSMIKDDRCEQSLTGDTHALGLQ